MTKFVAIALQIVAGDARPIFRQIVDAIRKDIANGKLPSGSKLPSVRGLAMQLTVNANTVAKAYNELVSQGLLESHLGLGMFVSEPQQLLSYEEQEKRLKAAIESFANEVMYLDYRAEDMTEQLLEELKKLNRD